MSRVIVAFSIFASLLLVEHSVSDAPQRVHLATAGALLIGFVVPALSIGSLSDFRRRWRLVTIASVVGAILFGWLTSLVVVKAEFAYLWYIKYPVFALGFAVLLFLHAAVTGVIARRTAAAN